jgi:hypothetical protein
MRIDLKAANGDIALSYDARFDQQKIVLNTMHGGVWAREQYLSTASLRVGVPFELTFKIKDDRFVIKLNGEMHGEFNHRMALNVITDYEMSGFDITDVDIPRRDIGVTLGLDKLKVPKLGLTVSSYRYLLLLTLHNAINRINFSNRKLKCSVIKKLGIKLQCT